MVEVESEADQAMRTELADLRMKLLERDAVVAELREQLGGERQEVVRNMAKLQSQASRAEAASELAEAQIAIGTLSEVGGAGASDLSAEATQLLDDARSAFNTGNFGGALYLATRARTMASAASTRLRTRSRSDAVAGETPFMVPVRLTTTVRSNVRGGPGTGHAVVFVADPGARLQGLAYTSDWILVRNDSGQEGWIFHELVADP